MNLPSKIPALTISQPWASLIAAGIKRVENRTWSTRYRGPLFSHPALFGPLIAAMHAAGHRFFCTSSHGRHQWPADCERLRQSGIDPGLISPEMMYAEQHGSLQKKADQADQLDFVFDDDLRIQQFTRTPVLCPSVDGVYSFRDHS